MTVLLSYHIAPGKSQSSRQMQNQTCVFSFCRIDLDPSKGHSSFIRFSRMVLAVLEPCSPRLFKRSTLEDFGKRFMPGKRARRDFSQVSEFERGLIIGMKTAGWSTRRIAGQVDRSECAVRNCWEQWIREGTHGRKTGSGATRKTTRREDRRIMEASTCGPHSDSFNDTSRHRRSNCSTNNLQTRCRSKS
ncbi:transposable element Tcb2 transposase [Trichonephila clavipes]|nr:transposable element Tcb2 transposase [Trichonephila clavipes]